LDVLGLALLVRDEIHDDHAVDLILARFVGDPALDCVGDLRRKDAAINLAEGVPSGARVAWVAGVVELRS
jgi:hypothetical protein